MGIESKFLKGLLYTLGAVSLISFGMKLEGVSYRDYLKERASIVREGEDRLSLSVPTFKDTSYLGYNEENKYYFRRRPNGSFNTEGIEERVEVSIDSRNVVKGGSE